MGTTSVSGKGNGNSKKLSLKDLSLMLSNGPYVIFAGTSTPTQGGSSPPSSPPMAVIGEVIFPYVLEGGSSNYSVLLTTKNSGYAYTTSLNEDDDGNFTGFDYRVSSGGDVMYMVVKNGVRPKSV